MVIVTKNQYILAKSIQHITLDENVSYDELYVNGKNRMIRTYTYNLHVSYIPEQQTQNTRDEIKECVVVIRGKVNAYQIYKDLIGQIREQCPDQLFLDKALEDLLSPEDFKQIAIAEEDDKEFYSDRIGVKCDRGPKKIRYPRKAKKRHQGLLRNTKTRR